MKWEIIIRRRKSKPRSKQLKEVKHDLNEARLKKCKRESKRRRAWEKLCRKIKSGLIHPENIELENLGRGKMCPIKVLIR